MNTASLILLLQATASLLIGAKSDASLSPTNAAAIAALANRTVQIVAQATAPIGFPVTPNTGTWPTITDLVNSAYLNADGGYVRLHDGVALDEGSVSFGDLNGDGLDDAAGVVMQTTADGGSRAALAFFLNQGGVMFNIADLPLGQSATIYSHEIMNGTLTIDMQVQGAARATSTYELVGNSIVKVQ